MNARADAGPGLIQTFEAATEIKVWCGQDGQSGTLAKHSLSIRS